MSRSRLHSIYRIATKSFSVLLFLGCLTNIYAQGSDDLTQKRNEVEQRIRLNNDLLSDIRSDRNSAAQSYKTLKAQVVNRENLIAIINEEMEQADAKLIVSNTELTSLQGELTSLKDEYNEILRARYRQKLVTDKKWLYLLSSKSLKQLILRHVYTRQFEQYCNEKRKQLASRLGLVQKENNYQTEQKQEKQSLLDDMDQQRAQMDNDLIDQEVLLEQLRKSEDQILADLRRRERERDRLDELIKSRIVAVAKKIKTESPTASKPTETVSNTKPKAVTLASEFGLNKGKLLWPVDGGWVVNKFGKRSHEILKNVSVSNNGIDIQAKRNQAVLAIFDGVVMDVINIGAQDGYMVLLRHGAYLTAYLGIENPNVQSQDKVTTGSTIGNLIVKNDVSVLQFQIWKETQKLNPSLWLRRQ